MAANPQIPPREPLEPQKAATPTPSRKVFPWGLVAAIIVVVILGLLAYYFFA